MPYEGSMLMCLKEFMILPILMQKIVDTKRSMLRDDCSILMVKWLLSMQGVDIQHLIFLDQLGSNKLYRPLLQNFFLVRIFAMFLLSKNSMDNIQLWSKPILVSRKS